MKASYGIRLEHFSPDGNIVADRLAGPEAGSPSHARPMSSSGSSMSGASSASASAAALIRGRSVTASPCARPPSSHLRAPRPAHLRPRAVPPTTKALLVRRTGPVGNDLREAKPPHAPPGRHTASGIAPDTVTLAQRAPPNRATGSGPASTRPEPADDPGHRRGPAPPPPRPPAPGDPARAGG